MIYIIFGLLTVLLNLYLAKQGGFNLWIIGILSLFLGIFVTIGLLLFMVFGKNRDNTAVEWNSMKKCPYCAEMIKKEAKVCRYCGKEIEGKHTYGNRKVLIKGNHPTKQKSGFTYNPNKKD